MEAVFQGITVADFTWALAGPQIVRYLADYGATAVRVETIKRPCIQRVSGGPYKDGLPGVDRSGYFAYYNANKYSLALDLNHPRARDVVKRLVSWADVVVENFTPGQMEKWDLSYDELAKINPGIIMLRTSAQGETGPYAKHPALGTQLMGLSGFVHLTGYADRDPVPLVVAYTDTIAPRFGIAALIAALDYRSRTGKGQYLDLSQLETSLYFLGPVILDYTVNGRVANRMGNSSPCAAPHGVYPCKGDDRWCAIAVFSDQEWVAFCQAIGEPPWTKDPKFATLNGRKENEAELDSLIGESSCQFTAEELMELLQRAGIAAGVVATPQDVYEDPQLQHRHCFWPLEHKVIGTFPHLGQYSILSKTPAEARMPSPCLGEHTEKVCTEFLGMSEKEFDDLLIAGVFQ